MKSTLKLALIFLAFLGLYNMTNQKKGIIFESNLISYARFSWRIDSYQFKCFKQLFFYIRSFYIC